MIKPLTRTAIPALMLLWGAEASAEDLVEIYNAAVNNDPVYQSQALTLKAEQEGPASTRADLLPNVRLFAARARNDEQVTGAGATGGQGSAAYNSNEYGVSVTQTLYNKDRFIAYEQSKLQAEAAAAQFRRAQQDLILRVVERYLGVLSAQDNLELAVAEQRAIQRQLELARSRLEVGLGTSTDLHDARARFELAQAQEIRAQQALEDAYQALEELIGRRVEKLNGLREDSPLTPPTPTDPDTWVERSKENNLELIAASLNEEISKREVTRQKARRMPSLDLVVSHNVSDASGSIRGGDVDRTATAARLQLELPIYQGGGISADGRAASYRFQAAEQRTESALRAATRNASSAYLEVATSVREANALDQAVLASEKALESRKEGFEAGLNTNLDVLDAQRDLFQARRDYLNARYRYITNNLELFSVAGELDVEDVETVNDWLE
ncbi:MAG: TolC family outer membrane protein [Gammaproteobacteria bacterium]|nr:TolC family outer membrane protein [Gammaproteobacteria bacterium]